MIRVFIADTIYTERSALRLILQYLDFEIAGEADNWPTTLAELPISRSNLLLVDWELLSSAPGTALEELRRTCPKALIIILISRLEARQQAAFSVGADVFISKNEMPERVIEQLRAAAQKIRD